MRINHVKLRCRFQNQQGCRLILKARRLWSKYCERERRRKRQRVVAEIVSLDFAREYHCHATGNVPTCEPIGRDTLEAKIQLAHVDLVDSGDVEYLEAIKGARRDIYEENSGKSDNR
jgi:hypothetical protein